MTRSGCIYNTTTSRCVKIDGKKGKEIIANSSKSEIKKLTTKCANKTCTKQLKTPEWTPPITPDWSLPPTPNKKGCIDRSEVMLLPHQIKVVEYLNENRGVIAVHSVGSGKTLTAVTASQCFLDRYPDRYVVVVSPVTLIDNYKKEMEKYGISKDNQKYKFFSFEKFQRLTQKKTVQDICGKNFLIVDEAHILRTVVDEFTGKKSRAVLECARNAEKVLLLTATPFVNNSYDLENLISMVKGKMPMSENNWNTTITSKNKFLEYAEGCFSYHKASKLEKEFPEKIIHERIISMDEKFFEQYRQIELFNEKFLKRYLIYGDPFVFLQGVRTGLLKLPDSAKINWAVKNVKEWLLKKQKTVVFSNFVEAGIKKLEEQLKDKVGMVKYSTSSTSNVSNVNSYTVISGGVNIKKRKEIIDKFNDDKIDLLILSGAGGVGIDLKGVRNMVILDVPWNKANLNQIIGRAIRFQSHVHLPVDERKVDVWILYTRKPSKHTKKDTVPSADMILYRIIEEKEKKEKEVMKWIKEVSI